MHFPSDLTQKKDNKRKECDTPPLAQKKTRLSPESSLPVHDLRDTLRLQAQQDLTTLVSNVPVHYVEMALTEVDAETEQQEQFNNLVICIGQMTEQLRNSDALIKQLNAAIALSKEQIEIYQVQIQTLNTRLLSNTSEHEQELKVLLLEKESLEQQAKMSFSSTQELEKELQDLVTQREQAQITYTELQETIRLLEMKITDAQKNVSQLVSVKEENDALKQAMDGLKKTHANLTQNEQRLSQTMGFFINKPGSTDSQTAASLSI